MVREQSDVRRWHPKRLSLDPSYRASVEVASSHHLPHSEFLDWHPHDQQAEFALRVHESEKCPDCGVHPDAVRTVKPGWAFCSLCAAIAHARSEAGIVETFGTKTVPPGWRLTLEPIEQEAPDGG